MSAHGKENGKGAEPDWARLSCDADGQAARRGSHLVKKVRAERESNPSATVWSVAQVLIRLLLRKDVWRLRTPLFRGATKRINKR